MRLDRPIAVVGAGIAGLTAALALAAHGFDVEIFERSRALEPVGAGIQLSPNALRALETLDLGAAVRAVGTAADHVLLRSGRTGRVLRRVPVMGGDGTGYLAVLRADVQSALEAAVRSNPRISLTLGAELVAIQNGADETQLRFRTETGDEERRYPLVIAADGVHSRAARLLGHRDAASSGRIALRWLREGGGQQDLTSIEAWLGPARHVVAYPVKAGTATNIVALVPESDTARSDFLEGWEPRLRSLIEGATAVGTWPLLATPADRPAVSGRSVLVGDAAHAMLPYAAQGAAMAIEDAVVLAHHLSSAPDLGSALSRYDRERVPRLGQVRGRVAFHRRVYHLPMPLALGRNLVLAMRSEASLAADLSWLYDWTPPAVGARR